MVQNVQNYLVMPAKCVTCPFRTDEHGRHPNPQLTSKLMQQVICEASQICHHPRQAGKPETHLCRGARDYQLTIFHRLGVIPAPTDAAWQETIKKFNSTNFIKQDIL
ncbi:hypothetical protein [Tolypothrix sp. VBCCA 56010]|uniref:hypothetical protein n=1 Tax=Tolypothrix sp. VBCCA 56010 TaxID=3137731 RepID=UPI003D7E4873